MLIFRNIIKKERPKEKMSTKNIKKSKNQNIYKKNEEISRFGKREINQQLYKKKILKKLFYLYYVKIKFKYLDKKVQLIKKNISRYLKANE